MKLIIAGSRTLYDYALIDKAIAYAKTCTPSLDMPQVTEIVEGEARGIDSLAKIWANNHKIPVKEFPAKWDKLDVPGAIVKEGYYGKYNARAGLSRNQEMLEYVLKQGKDKCGLLAIVKFPSPGTEHMIQCAKAYGLVCWIYEI